MTLAFELPFLTHLNSLFLSEGGSSQGLVSAIFDALQGILSGLLGLLVDATSGIIPIFWDSTTGLTLYGVLLLFGLGMFFLMFAWRVIQGFLRV